MKLLFDGTSLTRARLSLYRSMFDVTDPDSLDEVRKRMARLREMVEPYCVFVLVGCKGDKADHPSTVHTLP